METPVLKRVGDGFSFSLSMGNFQLRHKTTDFMERYFQRNYRVGI